MKVVNGHKILLILVHLLLAFQPAETETQQGVENFWQKQPFGVTLYKTVVVVVLGVTVVLSYESIAAVLTVSSDVRDRREYGVDCIQFP